MQERRNAEHEEHKAGWKGSMNSGMQDRRDKGKEGYMIGRMQEKRMLGMIDEGQGGGIFERKKLNTCHIVPIVTEPQLQNFPLKC